MLALQSHSFLSTDGLYLEINLHGVIPENCADLSFADCTKSIAFKVIRLIYSKAMGSCASVVGLTLPPFRPC